MDFLCQRRKSTHSVVKRGVCFRTGLDHSRQPMLCTKGYRPGVEEATNNVKICIIRKLQERTRFCHVHLDQMWLQCSDALGTVGRLAFGKIFVWLLF